MGEDCLLLLLLLDIDNKDGKRAFLRKWKCGDENPDKQEWDRMRTI